MLDEVVIALTDVNVSIKEGFPVSRIKTFGDVIYLGEINEMGRLCRTQRSHNVAEMLCHCITL